jgi:hypothetical protein
MHETLKLAADDESTTAKPHAEQHRDRAASQI